MFFKLFGNKKSNNEEHVESSVPTAVAATLKADPAQEAIPEPVQTVSAPPPAAKAEPQQSEPPKLDLTSYEGRLDFLQKRLSGLHNGITALSPLELVTSNDHLPQKLLIVGHCGADHWGYHRSNPTKTPTEFLLVNNLQVLPERTAEDLASFDFQVVNFPLRFVMQDHFLWGAASKSDAEIQAVFQRSVDALQVLFDLYLQYNEQHRLLTFVTNFMVPSFNPLGKLMPHYDLRNPAFFVQRINQELEHMVRARSNVYMLDLDGITSYFGKRYMQEDLLNLLSHGSYMPGNLKDESRIEHAPPLNEHYRLDAANFLAMLWVEFISAFRIANPRNQVKLIVVDLDDTLWNGVVGDMDNPDVSIAEGWPSGLLEALSYFKDRGGLIAIVSKNQPDVVKKVWDSFYESRFPLRHFVAVKCGFIPKSQMVAEVLKETQLTDMSVLVIDDNPSERAEIKMAFPKIRILHGYHYYWRKIIMLAAETQVAFISRESSQKTDLLKSQIERQTMMQSAHSRDTFLADLQVKTKLKRLTAQDEQALQRCHELLNKTNQFNTTTVRRSLAEFTQFVNAHAVYFFQVSDRFTDHGIVGLVLLQGSSIEQFVMSCRVVGLDVEYGVLNLLMDILNARQPGQAVTARMTVADKNLLSRAIFSDCGFEQILDSDVWRLVEFEAPTFQGQFEWVR